MPKRVLFLCIGNSCRSQMAEWFARTYGKDVIDPVSAGLYPATYIAPLTRKVMLEKNIDMATAFPKQIAEAARGGCDLIVNMSAQKLPNGITTPEEVWTVRDPIGLSEEVFRDTANQIEQLVMRLILRLRTEQSSGSSAAGKAPVPIDRRRTGPRQ